MDSIIHLADLGATQPQRNRVRRQSRRRRREMRGQVRPRGWPQWQVLAAFLHYSENNSYRLNSVRFTNVNHNIIFSFPRANPAPTNIMATIMAGGTNTFMDVFSVGEVYDYTRGRGLVEITEYQIEQIFFNEVRAGTSDENDFPGIVVQPAMFVDTAAAHQFVADVIEKITAVTAVFKNATAGGRRRSRRRRGRRT